MDEFPDPTVIFAVIQAILLLQVAGNGGIVFDDFPIKVGDPNTARWADGKMNRMKPDVTRSEEFRMLLSRQAPDVEKHAVALKIGSVDKILRGSAGKDLPGQLG